MQSFVLIRSTACPPVSELSQWDLIERNSDSPDIAQTWHSAQYLSLAPLPSHLSPKASTPPTRTLLSLLLLLTLLQQGSLRTPCRRMNPSCLVGIRLQQRLCVVILPLLPSLPLLILSAKFVRNEDHEGPALLLRHHWFPSSQPDRSKFAVYATVFHAPPSLSLHGFKFVSKPFCGHESLLL